MTNFKLDRSHVGYTYEEINPVSHKWTSRKVLTQIGGVPDSQVRDWLSRKRVELQARDDVRALQPVWTPDTATIIPVSTFDEALALHHSTWGNGEPTVPLYVVIEGNIVRGVSIHGPFTDEDDAHNWAHDSDYNTVVAKLEQP